MTSDTQERRRDFHATSPRQPAVPRAPPDSGIDFENVPVYDSADYFRLPSGDSLEASQGALRY
eukprot:462802-Pyramimonas_sp.AAC.1